MDIYRAIPMSREQIREIVRKIRRVIGYENILNFPIVYFIENVLPVFFKDFSFEILPEEEIPNICGAKIFGEHKIILNEDIYNKAVAGDGFARSSCAHEVGHLFLHDIENISFCKIRPGEQLKAFESPEWQADAFAGELLAPSYLIKCLTIDEIINQCGITKQAAIVQKSKLNKKFCMAKEV